MKTSKPFSLTPYFLLLLLFGRVSTQASLTDGLNAYFPFNGNANDESGNGNNGSIFGATLTTDRFGNANSAFHFAGDGSYISVPDSPSLDMTSGITLSTWVRIEAGGYVQPRILEKHVFDLGLNDITSSPQVFLNIQPYSGSGANVITDPVAANEWLFLVGTCTGGFARLYTNGILAAEINTSITLDVNDLPIGIGRNLDSSSGADWFKGIIDDVRIYDRALSSSEVTSLFQIESVPEPSTVALTGMGFVALILNRRKK